ncbi:MAG: LD-carboxypeptidase [Bacteroidales bacterium]|nr:LD-carboxypeptidase [Bacteroidales bacterium]
MSELSYIQPSFLKPGDVIGLIAPARKISEPEVKKAVQIIQVHGYKVLFGKNLFGSYGSFSGTDSERSADLKSMIENPEVKAILSVRGGYGCVRIVDSIPFELIRNHSKWLIGYSDLTVLHSELHRLGVQSLHASMPINFPENTPEALHSLFHALEGSLPSYKWNTHPLNRKGKATGVLTGGNISVLYSLLGSDTFPDTENKILFLEDLDEYLYHIDRMMQAFKRAGKLNRLSGLLVGGLTDMHDNTVPFGKNAEEIIRESTDEYNYPVAFDFPAGHLKDNRALVLGHSVTLDVAAVSTLNFNP